MTIETLPRPIAAANCGAQARPTAQPQAGALACEVPAEVVTADTADTASAAVAEPAL